MEVACSVQSLRSVKNIHRISVWNAAQLALLTYREQEDLRIIIDGMGRLSAQAQHLRTPITDYGRLKAGSHTLYLCTTGVQGKPEFILAKGMLKVGKKNLYIRKDNGQLVEMSPLCVLDFYVHESCQRMGLGHELFETMLTREKTSARELGQFPLLNLASNALTGKEHGWLRRKLKVLHYILNSLTWCFGNCIHTQCLNLRTTYKPDRINELFYTAGFLCPWLRLSVGSSYDRPSSKFHSFLDKYYHLRDYLPQANQYVVFKDYFNTERTTSNSGSARDDWGRHGPGAGYLDSSCKKDKVLHGRRANIPEASSNDGEFCPPVRKLEPDVEGSNDVAVADSCSSQQQQPCGRRQSRHHMANFPVVNKVTCRSNSIETQRHLSSHFTSPAITEGHNLKVRNAAAGECKPSINGRRSTFFGTSKSNDAGKRSDKAPRYPSPPSIPKPFEDGPKEDSSHNPYKFQRTESTRSRLFHEDSFEKITRPPPPLKCPFWTEEAHAFNTKSPDCLDKIDLLASIPVTFENTRFCYHAGMRGYGTAEAMGWSSSLIK